MADIWNEGSFSLINNGNTAILIITVLAFFLFLFRNSHRKIPPCRAGFLPWIGCAIEFGKAPLWFIESSRQKLGPIFTLKVAGKRLTFLTEFEDFSHFFTSLNVDFQQAVQDPVQHTASVSKESFFKYHTKIHDTVKATLAPSQLEPFCENLFKKFSAQLEDWSREGEVDLNQLVRRSMYIAVLDNLFGDNVLPTKDKELFAKLEKHFVTYDDQFEYGSQLPEIFIKDWSKSKWWLLGNFQIVARQLLNEDSVSSISQETMLMSLFQTVDRRYAANYGLLLMWASLANAIPITFWSLAFILEDKQVQQKVCQEIADVWTDQTVVSQQMVSKLVYTKKCILETIRLRSPGVITRAVVKPMQVKGMTIPAGDHLMLSPYWAHRNPKYFPQPEAFKPERWDAVDVGKNQFLEGFVAFGGGRYQCPGRWFAFLEITLLVAMVMKRFDIALLDKVPAQSPLHLVGTQQPVGPLRVSCKLRV